MKSALVKVTSVLFIIASGILIASAFLGSGFTFPVVQLAKSQDTEQQASPARTPVPADKDKTSSDVSADTYKQTVARLRAYSDQGRFVDLVAEADAIQTQWGSTGGERYGLLFLEFLGELTSGRILEAHPNAWDLSQKYVVAALITSDTYDLETEWALLRYLHYPARPTSLDSEWVEQRRQRVKLWLHALNRLETEKDETFDPEDSGPIKVNPPSGTTGFPGMGPEQIKDPVLRAEYKKAIDENNKRIRNSNHQLKLRQNEQAIIRGALKYISTVYARPPSDIEELRRLLREYKISDDLRKVIETETKKAIDADGTTAR